MNDLITVKEAKNDYIVYDNPQFEVTKEIEKKLLEVKNDIILMILKIDFILFCFDFNYIFDFCYILLY